MQENERIVEPFKKLGDLYKNLKSLVYWPGIVKLRKSTDYVYQGTDDYEKTDVLTKLPRSSVPKTIVCHDLMGGYLEDRFIDGSSNHNSYHFYHWNIVDTFIYFSHHFVTIPPYGWINAAHKHGVKILGTVITETAKGQEVWNEILKTRDSIIQFADALIYLAQFYKFEGWLLNIENEIKETDVKKLTFFVKYLTDTIHKKIDGSEVIWYDSVISTGKLVWQNELNEKNECFFDSCDGIFLNYTWSDSGLIKSAIKADKSHRVKDIYVGLDVWGRGCPGGGGFNSAYALQRIRKQGLSVAIFAPAWTFEYFGPATFAKVENIFWAQLMQQLYIHVPMYENETFLTTFCRGAGIKYFEYGMQIQFQDSSSRTAKSTNNSFYNMAMQKHQAISACSHLRFISMHIPRGFPVTDQTPQELPTNKFETLHDFIRMTGNRITFEPKPEPRAESNCVDYSYDLSYEGGGCLKLITKNVKSYHKLFYIQVQFLKDIQARVIYRPDVEDNSIILVLGSNSRTISFLPRETLRYGQGWKMSIFQTNLRNIQEIGISLDKTGICYLGKIVLEEIRRPQHFIDGT